MGQFLASAQQVVFVLRQFPVLYVTRAVFTAFYPAREVAWARVKRKIPALKLSLAPRIPARGSMDKIVGQSARLPLGLRNPRTGPRDSLLSGSRGYFLPFFSFSELRRSLAKKENT